MTTLDHRQRLAVRIEKIRKDRGSTKRHIYTAAGMSPATYNGRITGQSDFKFTELVDIAKALGMKTSELTALEGSDDV